MSSVSMSQSSSPLLFHLTTGGDRLRWHRYQRTMMNILSLSFNNFNEPQTEFTTVRAHAEGWNNWIFSARRISTRESNKHVAVERERERNHWDVITLHLTDTTIELQRLNSNGETNERSLRFHRGGNN